MEYITAASIILISSIYAFIMPDSIDKELTNKDNIAAIHAIEYPNDKGE